MSLYTKKLTTTTGTLTTMIDPEIVLIHHHPDEEKADRCKPEIIMLTYNEAIELAQFIARSIHQETRKDVAIPESLAILN